MIITGNQLSAELQGNWAYNYATIVLMSGTPPSDFSTTNSGCRTSANGGYVYVGTTARDYLKTLGTVLLSVSGFAPMTIREGILSVSPQQRDFLAQLSSDITPTWAVVFARHQQTTDFLNSSLQAYAAMFMTVGSAGTEDIVLPKTPMPKGSVLSMSAISVSALSVVG